MRDLKINQSPVFYKLYLGIKEIVDQYGNATGTYLPEYSELKSAMLTVSPNKGYSEVEQFGTSLDYSRTMTTSDADCEIDENAVLWLDDADTTEPWNYVVVAVARWKNSSQYAVRQVDISTYNSMISERKDKGTDV